MKKHNITTNTLDDVKKKYPLKFAQVNRIFENIHTGDRIFISTACGEPQHMIRSLLRFIDRNPNTFLDAEVFQVWPLGQALYTQEKYSRNFRLNSFFIGDTTLEAVNRGLADYTPMFHSQVSHVFSCGAERIDIALVQTSVPDRHGFMSLGVSVDIVKSAAENASLVIAQVNSQMPRILGDTFIHISDVDFIVPCNEPLLEFKQDQPDEIEKKIACYVSKIVQDGDTIQVGFGRLPDAIISSLKNRNHLGVHTELLTDSIVKLMKKRVIDNSNKNIDRGKTVASLAMGTADTFEYINDNPLVEFRTVEYTNNPSIIAGQKNMIAINTALQVDLTGQSSSESPGKYHSSGFGGHVDFMRSATLSQGGKAILVMRSTSGDGKSSTIVPFLDKGAGVSLTRGDIQYLVTEYGVACLHEKNIRERAMDLIAIAHPDFRPWLVEKARENGIIYKNQSFIPGKSGVYPERLEIHRETRSKTRILLRPVKINDEPLLKDFFHSLSDRSTYCRFFSLKKNMSHDQLQKYAVIDYTAEMVILAVIENDEQDQFIAGLGQYSINKSTSTAEVAIVVRDEWQGGGIGTELINYLTDLAKKQRLSEFRASVLIENRPVLTLFKKVGFEVEGRITKGVCQLKLMLN